MNYGNWQNQLLEVVISLWKAEFSLLHLTLPFQVPSPWTLQMLKFKSVVWNPLTYCLFTLFFFVGGAIFRMLILKVFILIMHSYFCVVFKFFWNKIVLGETSENMNQQWTGSLFQNNDPIVKWLNTGRLISWYTGMLVNSSHNLTVKPT